MFVTSLKIENFAKHIDEFLELYKSKPVFDNTGGMKSPHLFNTFCVLKELNPTLIIESGVWKGQGTWLFENTCPDAAIVSFDVYFGNLIYKSNKVQYVNNDITTVDWKNFFETSPFNPNTTLLFLDDHMNFIDRLSFIKDSPFENIIFEDNYPPNQGDCISPKKILECEECIIDRDGRRETVKISKENKELFHEVISSYQELPPIYKPDKTRWGDEWGDIYKTPEPHFEFGSLTEQILEEEMYDYTWICYMEKNK